jgi:hypothetical protein
MFSLLRYHLRTQLCWFVGQGGASSFYPICRQPSQLVIQVRFPPDSRAPRAVPPAGLARQSGGPLAAGAGHRRLPRKLPRSANGPRRKAVRSRTAAAHRLSWQQGSCLRSPGTR